MAKTEKNEKKIDFFNNLSDKKINYSHMMSIFLIFLFFSRSGNIKIVFLFYREKNGAEE